MRQIGTPHIVGEGDEHVKLRSATRRPAILVTIHGPQNGHRYESFWTPAEARAHAAALIAAADSVEAHWASQPPEVALPPDMAWLDQREGSAPPTPAGASLHDLGNGWADPVYQSLDGSPAADEEALTPAASDDAIITCYLDATPFTYATARDALVGYYRLCITAVVFTAEDGETRSVTDTQGHRFTITSAQAQVIARRERFDANYRQRLYTSPDADVLREIRRNGHLFHIPPLD